MSKASLRANVPSCRLRAASYVLRRGVAGVQFAFLLQAFSFSNKKKMPKRGKCKNLTMIGREGKGKLPSIKYLYRLSPIADSRKGCPYKRSVMEGSRILCRLRGNGASRSPHPTSCASKKFVQISRADNIHPTAYIYYLERSEITPQSRLTPSQLPYRGA